MKIQIKTKWLPPTSIFCTSEPFITLVYVRWIHTPSLQCDQCGRSRSFLDTTLWLSNPHQWPQDLHLRQKIQASSLIRKFRMDPGVSFCSTARWRRISVSGTKKIQETSSKRAVPVFQIKTKIQPREGVDSSFNIFAL